MLPSIAWIWHFHEKGIDFNLNRLKNRTQPRVGLDPDYLRPGLLSEGTGARLGRGGGVDLSRQYLLVVEP